MPTKRTAKKSKPLPWAKRALKRLMIETPPPDEDGTTWVERWQELPDAERTRVGNLVLDHLLSDLETNPPEEPDETPAAATAEEIAALRQEVAELREELRRQAALADLESTLRARKQEGRWRQD